jgi:DUF177 domain-containing protein
VSAGSRAARGRAQDLHPLTWNAAALLAEPPGATRDYRVAGVTIPLPDELRLADPIEGTVRLARTNRGLLATAELRTAIEAQCSRCLRDIVVPLELRIDDEALPSVDLVTGQPVDADAEPDTLRMTDHHELDLAPVVAEAISLAEPIAPLCRPDCKGLCPFCGESRETGDHNHDEDDIDPRLAALREFRTQDAGPQADDDPNGTGAPGEVDGRRSNR